MGLKQELDRIHNLVYNTNESNSEDRMLIIAGYEDTVNEGLGKLLGKLAGKIASAPRKIASKAKDLYNKGVELGKKAVGVVTDFFKRTGERISAMLDQWGTKIKEGWANFTAWCKRTYNNISLTLIDFWESTKEKGEAFKKAIGVFWENMKNKLKKAFEDTKRRFQEWGGNISKWVTDNWKQLKEWSADKYEGAVEWLRQKYDAALEAIRTGKGKLEEARKWIVTWLVVKPYTWISQKLSKIPELYNQFKAWLEKQAMEFKLGFEETAGRPFDREKGFIIPKTFQDVDVSGTAPEEEEVFSNYDESKNPFSLGAGNEWKILGLEKRTTKGKNTVQNILNKYNSLKEDGLTKNEIVLSIGAWMAETYSNSGVVRDNSEQNLVVKPGEEDKADELKDRIDKETDKAKLSILKRELRGLMKYSDAKVDEDSIGKTTVEVIEKILEDPRIFLYIDDAAEEDVEAAIGYLANNGLLDTIRANAERGSRKPLPESEVARNVRHDLSQQRLTEMAKEALIKHVSKMPKKKNVMPLVEYEFDEGMKYIMTFEKFKG